MNTGRKPRRDKGTRRNPAQLLAFVEKSESVAKKGWGVIAMPGGGHRGSEARSARDRHRGTGAACGCVGEAAGAVESFSTQAEGDAFA
jgi:hypothetical protein